MYRIIPCLDMVNGKVVKGQKFSEIKELNSPNVLAEIYSKAGADEIVFYDISASIEKRGFNYDYIKDAIEKIDVPFCVGGGISTLEDIQEAIHMGAAKISINSQAIKDKSIISEGSKEFGSKRIVLAMDLKRKGNSWNVYVAGGKVDTGMDAIEWAVEAEKLGAGELVLNSIDEDGMKNGYDIELLKAIKEKVSIPIIASGGAGKMEDFYEGIVDGGADGVLGASVFHYGEIKIEDLKQYLKNKGISVKL